MVRKLIAIKIKRNSANFNANLIIMKRWEGEIHGKIGNFPSLVVDECDENGEPLTEPEEEEEDDEDDFAPPASFGLPPTVPSHLLTQEDIDSSFEQQQTIVDKKLDIDLSQPASQQKQQFQPPSGKL
jgi:hypothetical protein